MMPCMRALLIEDNPGDVRLIQEMLDEAAPTGCQVTVFDRLAEGQAALEAGGYDVVLLDLTLPDSVGLETLQSLVPEFARKGADFRITGLNDVCRDIFVATRMMSFVHVTEDTDTAVRSFR